jgi:hypothetical protein
VYAHGEAHGISHEQQPTIGVGIVVHCGFPLQSGPEGQGREERTHGVYFTFNSAEPEGVGKGVGQGTHGSSTKNGDGSGRCLLAQTRNQALGNGRDGPKEEQNGKTGRKRRQQVHVVCLLRYVTGKQVAYNGTHQLKKRSSGRVPHLQFNRGRNVFAAVPETGGGLYR